MLCDRLIPMRKRPRVGVDKKDVRGVYICVCESESESERERESVIVTKVGTAPSYKIFLHPSVSKK